MSLVDYASSDDEDTKIGDIEHENDQPSNDVVQPFPPPPPQPSTTSVSLNESSMDEKPTTASPIPAPTTEKLPDAALLLNSPILPYSTSGSADHSSRVAAAVAVNASRKREGNGSTTSSVRGKVPRGSVPHSKNIPDTSAGQLVPPQLRGRSNVVTEDISRLFVKKQGQS